MVDLLTEVTIENSTEIKSKRIFQFKLKLNTRKGGKSVGLILVNAFPGNVRRSKRLNKSY